MKVEITHNDRHATFSVSVDDTTEEQLASTFKHFAAKVMHQHEEVENQK